MDVAEQKNVSEPSAQCEESHDRNGDPSTRKSTTSDEIVKDLLNEVRSLEKPFSVEDLAAQKKEKDRKKKERKEHKHKKSKKKKKKHHSKHERGSSHKHSRSRSPSKKKHKKRSKHRSRSKSKTVSKSRTPSQTPTPLRSDDEEDMKEKVKNEPESISISTPDKSPLIPSKSAFREISDDDDLPVGADFRTVMNEAKKKINISSKIAAIPVAPPLAKPPSHAFPLSKTVKKEADDEMEPMEKRESEVLNKVIAEKGRGDFIPRNLKVKSSAMDNSTGQSNLKIEPVSSNETDMEPVNKEKEECLMDISADEADKEVEFGPSSLPPPEPTTSSAGGNASAPVPEPISDGELEKEIAEEINAAAQPKISGKSLRLAKVVESSSAVISKTVSKELNSRKRRRSPRKRTPSPDTDEELRLRAKTARSNKVVRRSPPRSRMRRRDDRGRRSRSRSRRRYSRSNSRSDSRDRYRRRSRSRTRSRSRSRSRSSDHYRSRRSRSRSSSRTRSRSRSHSRSRSRSASRSPRRNAGGGGRRRGGAGRNRRGRIDKAKLLAIARKKAQKMQLLGISLGSLDQLQNQPKSVDDFVSYCQQIQRRQDKEARREKGEDVSSDDESKKSGSRAGSPTSFKHPFGVKTAAGPSEGIKINIVNATSIPTKTPQERIIDSSQLRLVFPVSSGVTHKENAEKEWTPVVKNELKTCSAEQKKYVGITSLEAQKYYNSSPHVEEALQSSSSDHLLPPPPAPPILTGLGGLLPPPPPPPKLTAFDTLLPPPPPLPELLVVPSEEEMIIHEPDKIELAKKRDVAKVLAQRASAQLTLASNPNDFEAIRMLKEADDQMAAWAAAKNLPGKFTGSTGLNVLSSDELQPQDPRYNAWVRKDMFKNTRPTVGGVGMRLMQKMGWRVGEGLGPDGMGNVEPLVLDVKNDRKGLIAQDDPGAKSCAPKGGEAVASKHPVSMLMELCAKRKWPSPTFINHESGPSNMREFKCTVIVNDVEYSSDVISRSKKDAKSIACQIVLQSLGLIPRDPSLPVVI